MTIASHYQGQTGPKTLVGKRRSSMNALKTGIFAKTPVLPFEDERAYQRHVKSLIDSLQPEDALQHSIAQQIADSLWRGTRQDLRAALHRHEIFNELRPDALARMLNLTEDQVHYAPECILVPSTRFTKTEIKKAQVLHLTFLQWQAQAKGAPNHQAFWGLYQDLFKALGSWLGKQAIPELVMGTGQGFNLVWQQAPKMLEERMMAYGHYLWYVIHFEQLRPQLRNWMAIWYLIKGRHSQEVDKYDEVVLKERRVCQSLLDTFFKLRKSQAEHVLMRQFGGSVRKPNPLEGMATDMT